MGIPAIPPSAFAIDPTARLLTRSNSAFGGGQQASNRPIWPASAAYADTVVSSRLARLLVNGAASVRFVYSGSFKNGSGEDPMPNPLHVKTAVENPIGVIQPVTFNGKLWGTVMPNGLLVSDPIGVGVAPGGTIYDRCAISPPMAPTIAAAASTTGGNLAAATYFYKVTSVTEGGGESIASAEASAVVTGTTGSVMLTLGDRNMLYIPVIQYNIYRSTTSGAEILVGSARGGDRVWTDSGTNTTPVSTTIAATATTRQPTLVSTVGIKPGDTILVNGATSTTVLQVNSLTQIMVTTNLSVISGQSVVVSKTPPTATTNVASINGIPAGIFPNEGYRSGLDMAHTDNGFSFLTGTAGFPTAVALIAYPAKGATKPVVVLLGDSIMNGTGWVGSTTFGRGFANYALNDNFPYLNLSCGGETTLSFSLATRSANRLALAATGKYAIDEYGTNDLVPGIAATLKSYILTIARRVISMGLMYYRTTIIPKSGSTDGWQTYANQVASGSDADRQAVNQWLRAPASAGVGNSIAADLGALADKYGLFDTALAIENNADGSPITIDPATGAISNGSGGYWRVFGTTQYDSKSGTVSGTTTTLNDSGKAWTVNQWAGYMLASTNGATTQYTQVASNTATALTLNGTITAPSGSTTYYIFKGPTIDGTHPTDFGHILMASAVDTSKLV